MRFVCIFLTGVFLMQTGSSGGTVPIDGEYLSDLCHRIMLVRQGWGELGMDRAAHVPGQEGMPLRIKDRTYERGLGHHAPGEIVLELSGEFAFFEVEVGVQCQGGGPGSVIFVVEVDAERRFESGIMRETDPPMAVRVPIEGASLLRLVVTDAGDGITCDCANWAGARLVRSGAPSGASTWSGFDVAPFARVVTCDPERMDGSRANRVQEFREEDLFLDSPLLRRPDGSFDLPVTSKGVACVGLQWVERRHIRDLGLEFVGVAAPSPDRAEVQAWFGESAWQGGWKPLPGRIEPQGNRWRFVIEWQGWQEAVIGTEKIRWVFPSDGAVAVKKLSAFARGIWETADLRIEATEPRPKGPVQIEVYNGRVVTPDPEEHLLQFDWDPARPLDVTVLANRPVAWRSDRTVLRFQLPKGGFGVAVDDVLARGAVIVPHAGVFVSDRSRGPTPEEYPREHGRGKTILEWTRELADQTLAQAIEKIHNPAQNRAPTMLSLACDNRKFIVGRGGDIAYGRVTVTPRFGGGNHANLSRRIEGGWLPIPVTTVEEGPVAYEQRCFVAPFRRNDRPAENPWLAGESLFVSEFVIQNRSGNPASFSIQVVFESDNTRHAAAELTRIQGGVLVAGEGAPFGFVRIGKTRGTRVTLSGGAFAVEGTLPPEGKRWFTFYLPGWEAGAEDMQGFPRAPRLLRDTSEYWNRILATSLEFEIPDPFLTNVILASQLHCLIAARNEEEGRRIAPWIASVSYGPLESESNSIIRGMDFFGHHEFARRSLDFFIHRYGPEGFLTTGYTLMGTGWHLWTLGEHVDLAADTEWFRTVAPEVGRVCDWVMRQRRKTMKTDSLGARPPEYGLMPPGVMADWNAFRYYFCLNGYYCAGLPAAGRAFDAIGDPRAETLVKEAAEFREEILRAYHSTQSQMAVLPLRDGTWVPGYPTQVYAPAPTGDLFPGEDGNRSWCYDVELGAHHLVPQGVLDPGSREVGWMMDHMEDVQFLAEGWFDFPADRCAADPYNLGGFAKVQPYYCRNAGIYALRDDVKPFIRSYFNTIPSLLNLENLSFQEHFNGAGAWNKTHETGYFLHQTRTMLVTERGRELWLAPFVTNHWMKDGMSVVVRSAPTRFGPVSYRIKSRISKGFIEALIEPPTRSRPERIVIRLRHPDGKPMRNVTVNGRKHEDFDPRKEVVVLDDFSPGCTVRARF